MGAPITPEPHPADLDGIRKFHDAARGMRRVQLELDALSESFDFTGNEKMADRLAGLADDCLALSKLVNEAVADNINVMIQRTHESSRNMIMAAFAVAGIDMGEAA
jgi:hypothetical protein